MASYSKFKRIVAEVVARWRDTITGATPIDIDGAKKCIRALDKTAKVFVVDSPKQFYIAQAIMRGRLAKKNAVEICKSLNVDPESIAHIQSCGGTVEIVEGTRWFRRASVNLLDLSMGEFMRKVTNTIPESKRMRWRRRRTDSDNRFPFDLCDLNSMYSTFVRGSWTVRKEEEKALWQNIRYKLSFESPRVNRANMSLMEAISSNPHDILNNDFDPNSHPYDAVHTEIITKLLNIKDPAVTAHAEIFHYAPAMMQFKRGFLLLGKRPKISVDADGALHNETGPAVEFADGHKFWFIEGHNLTELGERIVMEPNKLTQQEIIKIGNEEERRIAIDRFGWGRYLQEGGGKVLDYRENWVDNTVEVLIKPPSRGEGRFDRDPLRMVLACRSTGRKYFVGVPPDRVDINSSDAVFVPQENLPNTRHIETCEMAQSWFANGGTCEYLPYASKPLNIIGAS